MDAIIKSTAAREELLSILVHMQEIGVPTDPFDKSIYDNLRERFMRDIDIEERVGKLFNADLRTQVEDLASYIEERDHNALSTVKVIVDGVEYNIDAILESGNKEVTKAAYGVLSSMARVYGYNDFDRRNIIKFEQFLEQVIHDENKAAGKDTVLMPGLGRLNGNYSPENVKAAYGDWPELADVIIAMSTPEQFGRSYVVVRVDRSKDVTFWNVFPTKYYGENPHKCLRIYRETVKLSLIEKETRYRMSVM